MQPIVRTLTQLQGPVAPENLTLYGFDRGCRFASTCVQECPIDLTSLDNIKRLKAEAGAQEAKRLAFSAAVMGISGVEYLALINVTCDGPRTTPFLKREKCGARTIISKVTGWPAGTFTSEQPQMP